MQKGWFGITLFVLLPLFLFSKSLPDQTIEQLSQKRYWHVLLHLKNGHSEIDDPSFFLSDPGHFSARNELVATLKRLEDANESFLCRYPARIAWLKTEIPAFFDDLNDTTCYKLEQTLQKEDIHYVTLVFPTAYINSPASMFGHTFLRLDRSLDRPLIGEAVNYAAQTGEENALIYTYYGLTGGYKGYFSVLPYYKKIKEYNAMEQRDMWEYTLDLNETEIRRMLYHLYELQGVYGDYYFFTKNCSYNLLWLLESARPQKSLTAQFRYKAIPIDTVRAVRKAGMISAVHYRPSQRKEMQALVARIDKVSDVRALVEDGNVSRIRKYAPMQQAYMTDLAIAELKHRRSQKQLEKKVYVKRLMRLLRYRSKLPTTEKPELSTPADPLSGHKSARITAGMDDAGRGSFSIKPAMHDIYDVETGFVRGAYIDFLSLQIDRGLFSRLDFVSVTSLVPHTPFFGGWSWQAQIALEHVREDRDYFTLGGGVGKSFVLGGGIVFALVRAKLYLADSSHTSGGLFAGYLKSLQNMKAGIIHTSDYWDDGRIVRRSEAFVTYDMGGDYALGLKLREDTIAAEKERRAIVSVFYYF